MNQKFSLPLALLLLLALAGCGAPGDAGASATASPSPTAVVSPTMAENHSDEMKLPYAVDLSPEDGADAVERDGDHENSPYFAQPDVYNLESTDSLTVLPHFKTIQQTSEWSCGVTSALMVLEWYGATGDWNEETLAALRHPLDGTAMEGYPGATLRQTMDIFDGVDGFTYTTTLVYCTDDK